jgi:hypothetical protein
METVIIPSIVVSLVVALVGYLLKRAIENNDKGQEKLGEALTAGLSKLEGALAALAEKHSASSESIVELRVRVAAVEARVERLEGDRP